MGAVNQRRLGTSRVRGLAGKSVFGPFASTVVVELLTAYFAFVLGVRVATSNVYHQGNRAGGWYEHSPRYYTLTGVQRTPLSDRTMKYYTSTTEYNCGIDLHARQMYVCVIPIPNREGKKLAHTPTKKPF